jgi:glycine/D-amino acid oxidase-like deaminating enzyme
MQETKSFDIVIIGAGVIGCAIAHSLTAAGLKVALLDQGQVGSGASGANFGMVQSNDVELKYSIPMLTASYSRFEALEEELGMPLGFRHIGALSLMTSETQWRAAENRVNTLARSGIACEIIRAAHRSGKSDWGRVFILPGSA